MCFIDYSSINIGPSFGQFFPGIFFRSEKNEIFQPEWQSPEIVGFVK